MPTACPSWQAAGTQLMSGRARPVNASSERGRPHTLLPRRRPELSGKPPRHLSRYPAARASTSGSCRRDETSSLRKARPRCVSTVFSVTNSVWAISRLVLPIAAISTTRRSLGVSESSPACSLVRGRTPIAASSARARRSSVLAPQRAASASPSNSGSRAAVRCPRGAQRCAQIDQNTGVLEARRRRR